MLASSEATVALPAGRGPARAPGRDVREGRDAVRVADPGVRRATAAADAKSLLAVLALGAKARHRATPDGPTGTTPRPPSTARRRRRHARVARAGARAAPPARATDSALAQPQRRERERRAPRRGAARGPTRGRVPTRAAPTLSSPTPRPTRSGRARGSDAASPHTSTRDPGAGAPPGPRRRRGRARAGRGRRTRPAAKRSTPSVAAVRSFVPIERKSDTAAISSARAAASGVSIMAPS